MHMDPIRKKELVEEEEEEEATSLDWRGRPSDPNKHGGFKAAAFVLGMQGFEIMGIAGVGNNLITYVINEMHFSLTKSANTVTNFVGTIFILALVGGFLSDSYLGSFWTLVIFAFVELSGFILLSVQAHVPELKPPKCEIYGCEEAKGFEALIFFMALYLVALGSGCVKPNMIAHGANQFKSSSKRQLSTYFNAAYFAFSMGQLLALTLLVWLQTHSGMDVGFGVSAAAMAIALITFLSGTLYYRNRRPTPTILTPFAQVIVAAIRKRNEVLPANRQMLHGNQVDDSGRYTERFRFLDKACIRMEIERKEEEISNRNAWKLCTVKQVEQVKMVLSLIPIFGCTIIFNTILAQLQTFSVQQGSSMNTHLTSSFTIPPASLQAIPYLLLIFLVPLYDSFFVPFARRFTSHPSGISPLQRIGFGLFLATFSMISAALMEEKRRSAATGHSGKIISIFWITPQFLIFGVSEMFTAVGLIELFYKESPKGMQGLLTAMTYCSYAFGFYLSSVLVSLVNKLSGGWLSDNDLNKDRLDLFYWMLAILSFLNFLNYLFWSRWFVSAPNSSSPRPFQADQKEDQAVVHSQTLLV